MTDLQKKLLMLMCEVDEICRKHDIEYMLFAGTALGAERHGGFIPWDDDADIIMTLPNYEKFLSIIGEEIKEDRAVDCLEMNSDYILSYARYVDLTSTAIQRHTLFKGCHLGVKLDIFCVVPTFEDEELIEKHRTDILAFTEVICTTGRMMTYRPEGFYPRYRQELSKMEGMGREKYIADNLDELTHRVTGKSNKCILFSGMASNTKLYSSEIFDEVEYVPFENTTLPVSKKNILFLEQHMGRDWMALPINVAEPRHLFLLDTEHSYADYLPKIKEVIDLKKAEQACIDKKEYNLYEKDIFRDVLANSQRIRNIYAAVSAEKKVNTLKKESKEPLFAELLDAYDDYYFAQLTRASKVHKLAVKLDRSMFEEALETLISEGRYYDAEAIINVSVNAGYIREDDAFAIATKEKSEACRALEETLYSQKDTDAAEKILSERQELKDTVTFIAADLFLHNNREMSEDEREELYTYSKSCMERHDTTGEIAALCGLIAEKLGNGAEAQQLFKEAMKTIRNGFLYQMLVDRGISTDIKFEAAREKEEGRAKSAIYPVMKKDKAKASPKILKRASREGCNSLSNRMRYAKYRKWVKAVKNDSEARFNDYADKLLNMKL